MGLAYFTSKNGVLPSAAPDPWAVIGAGGTLVSDGVQIAAVSAAAGYRRTSRNLMVRQRIEVQVRFRGVTNNPAWAGGAPGHVLWIDDGKRILGVALGTTIAVVNPATGAIVWTVPQDRQPGGFTSLRHYLLIKDGCAGWELHIDGVRVFQLPYLAAAETSGTFARSLGWAWLDASGSGTGIWDNIEASSDMVLPPALKVARVRSSMPGPLQAVWTGRHEAMLRAMMGVQHATQDAMQRAVRAFTGGTLDVESTTLIGDDLPSAIAGWTENGGGAFEVVRDRIRITGSTTPTYARWTATTPITEASAVYRLAATFTLRSDESGNIYRRVGPFLRIHDGSRQIGAYLVRRADNPGSYAWILSGDNLSGAVTTVGRLFAVEPHAAHRVELYLTSQERVVLFVDGHLVEDLPVSTFSIAAADFVFDVGTDGSATISADVDVDTVEAAVAYADPLTRPWFLRRIAERCLFTSGRDQNDLLDVWMGQREAVTAARGTWRTISDVRRVAHDDDAAMIVSTSPSLWYVGLTYPGITPVFTTDVGDIPDVAVEYRAQAPLLPPDRLEATITRYMLPRSIAEARFDARLTTNLETAPVADSFEVESVLGFAVDDDVELRERDTGTLLTLRYDAMVGMTDVGVRDYSTGGRDGTLSNANASVQNSAWPERQAEVLPGSTPAGIQTAAGLLPTTSAGFTVSGWFRNDAVHDGTVWLMGRTANGIATGGYTWDWSAAGNLSGTIYSTLSSRSTPNVAYAPAAGTWVWLAMRWHSGTATLSLWKDGVNVGETAGAFTALDPPATPIGFGVGHASDVSRWKGRHRDHALYERALTNTEMLALYNETTGRGDLRTDADLFIAYLPSGRPASRATHTGTPSAADTMDVWVEGRISAHYSLTGDPATPAVNGRITFDGRISDRLNVVTPGGVVEVVGTAVANDTWVEVFGISGGIAASERLHCVGTTPVTGTVAWTEVHGFILDTIQVAGTINVDDAAGGLTLYTITAGDNASGVHLFDPALLTGPTTVRLVADAATTAQVIIWGVVENDIDSGELVTLAGTTPVFTAERFANLRVIAAGYLAAARTITTTAQIINKGGAFSLVSSSASDTQVATAILWTTDKRAVAQNVTLNGTTPVALTPADDTWHVLGVKLASAAAGTVTLSQTGTVVVVVGTIAIGETGLTVDSRDILTDGQIKVEVTGDTPLTPEVIGILGEDENGDVLVEGVEVSAGTPVWTVAAFSRVTGIATGTLSKDGYVRIDARAWRTPNYLRVSIMLDTEADWTATPHTDMPTDGLLDAVNAEDVSVDRFPFISTDGQEFAGAWTSMLEQATILTINPTTQTVTTTPLAEPFTDAAVMRKAS